MSLKGLQRATIRAPQSFKQKFNIGEITKDAVYVDAERRFQELEKETKKLHDESKKYFEAINGMLNHQIEFSKAVQEIYRPISGRVSDPDSIQPEGNPEGIRACEEYESIVKELQETLAPELELIQSRIIGPADELLGVIKIVQKAAQKRDHKQLDFDRHKTTLKKLQDKKEKTLKDEKALYKAETDVEQATQDYEYFNDLLKTELPQLFALEREFIQPLFQSFYYMQLNIFYTLHEKMQDIDIGYFNLGTAIEDAFEEKRGDIQQQAEALAICKFKTTGHKKSAVARYGSTTKAIEGRKSTDTPLRAIEGRVPADAIARRRANSTETPPPPYTETHPQPSNAVTVARNSGATSGWTSAAKAKGAAPPPPKAKPTRLSGMPIARPKAQALYDYEAQAEGDLSFSVGDIIDVTTKGVTENEWWTGTLAGQTGQFPGNYVKLI